MARLADAAASHCALISSVCTVTSDGAVAVALGATTAGSAGRVISTRRRSRVVERAKVEELAEKGPGEWEVGNEDCSRGFADIPEDPVGGVW